MDYVNMIAHDYLAKNDFIKRKEYSICIVKDHSWYGYDVSENPFSIYIRDRYRHTKLHSILLYQFKTFEDTENFCIKIDEDKTVYDLMSELKGYNAALNKKIEKKVKQDKADFENLLKSHNITYQQLTNINNEYNNLPTYIKVFYTKLRKGEIA